MYLKCDLETYDLRDVNCKFDVILVEPPLEEYQRSVGLNREKYWSWDEVSIEISRTRYFLFYYDSDFDKQGEIFFKLLGIFTLIVPVFEISSIAHFL